MNSIKFAKRNFLEIVRDPLSLVFCLAFPMALLFLFQIFTMNMTPEQIVQNTPQFQISRLTPAITIFGFSFITLFSGMLVSKDRTTSLLIRLRTSPMRPFDFLLGYTLPMLPIACVQIILSYGASFFLGQKATPELFLSILTLFPIALLFIFLGILIGSIASDRAVGGISSVIINFAAIFGGMFMPLDLMAKVVKNIAYAFPFANAIKITSQTISGGNDLLIPWLNVIGYTLLLMGLSAYTFLKKINSDHA